MTKTDHLSCFWISFVQLFIVEMFLFIEVKVEIIVVQSES